MVEAEERRGGERRGHGVVEKEEEKVRENSMGGLCVCVCTHARACACVLTSPQGRFSPPILLTHPSPPTSISDTHAQKQCLLSH